MSNKKPRRYIDFNKNSINYEKDYFCKARPEEKKDFKYKKYVVGETHYSYFLSKKELKKYIKKKGIEKITDLFSVFPVRINKKKTFLNFIK